MSEIKYYQASYESSGARLNPAYAMSVLGSSFGDGDAADFGLFIVAHGHDRNGGASVAALAVRTVMNELLHNFYHPMLTDPNPPVIQEVLDKALQTADAQVRAKGKEGSAALTAVVVMDNLAHVAHIGNSRAYLISPNGLEQLTTDYAVPGGDATQDGMRALGYGSEKPSIDTTSRPLPSNASLLLCNKGHWSEDEILSSIKDNTTLEGICKALVKLSQDREGGSVALIYTKIPTAVK